MKNPELREQIVDVMREMDRQGLNHGTAGNVSHRTPEGLLISPSGVAAPMLAPHMVVAVDAAGDWGGSFAPSSEWAMHRDILAARPDVQAVVHCHSRFATTLACMGRTIPPLHYMTVITGHDEIPLAPYATFGSEALARGVVETLGDGFGCLMANHGQIAVAPDLPQALAIATEIEQQATYYHGALAAGGPVTLTDEQMADVRGRFATYGQKPDPTG
ncbi:MAG: class II aldolase/adducin family protein [Pseudomonadota bacterium]